MDTLPIKFYMAESNAKIVLEFYDSTKIRVDITGDIDLSEFVKELTFLIQKNCKLTLTKIELEDPKLQLIQKAIEDIITSFNESLTEEIEATKGIQQV